MGNRSRGGGIMKTRTSPMKVVYVSYGKPLIFREFELCNAPMGWSRLDMLRNRLRKNKDFANKFTAQEIKEINTYSNNQKEVKNK